MEIPKTDTSDRAAPYARKILPVEADRGALSTHVLLIEGDTDDRAQVARMVSELGPFDLEECDCLSEGLARIRRGGIDVVLLDLSLADMDGLAVLDGFRRALPHLAVVGLSGSEDPDVRDRAAQRGVQDFVAKGDFDGRLLRATVGHAIECARLTCDFEAQGEALAQSRSELQQLAHVASHDLREPLRMVSSYVQLLACRYQGRLDDEADRFIRYATEGAARMKAMIDDLLRYSRVGRGEPEREPVALGEVFEDVTADLGTRIREAGARVEADELSTVLGSRVQFYQLLRCLIDNSLQYRGSASPEIRVRAVCEGEQCTVSVSDNGIGFHPGQAERIFRPFQRLHGRDEYSGTGIGLALVRRIVERHGGRVWAESELGAGSVFHVRLPLFTGSGELLVKSSTEGTAVGGQAS